MPNRVALVGCGVMGGTIGTRLREVGETLAVFDVDAARMQTLADRCAVAARSAAESDYVILSLNSAAIVREAVFGPRGAAEGAKPGTLIIDMSSIDPPSTQALAAEAARLRLRWVDYPLSGGAPKALVGRLTVMAGGAGEDFEASKAVMRHLCANFTHMGPPGAGQTTKLINQVLCALHSWPSRRRPGWRWTPGWMRRGSIPRALSGGRADSTILQEFMAKFATRDYTPTGRIDNMVKDLNGVQDLARKTGTAMPLTAACAEIHRLLDSAGLGGADNAALMKYFDGPGMEGIQI